MSPSDVVHERLEAQGLRIRGPRHSYMACCPAHSDRSPSLKVTTTDDRVLLHCHAGCSAEEVLAALGLKLRDLFANRGQWRQRQRSTPRRDFYVVSVLGQHVAAGPKSVEGRDLPELASPLHTAVLRALHAHAFFAPRCCPSQELVAAEVRCSREHEMRARSSRSTISI